MWNDAWMQRLARHARSIGIALFAASITGMSGAGASGSLAGTGTPGAYATDALAGVAATSAAGRTPAEFGVSHSGAATYRIPLWTPPGVGEVGLDLALVYASRSGSGPVGVGWSIAGLSTIARCNRTWAQDGAAGSVTNTLADRYCLDGQQLKLVSGTHGTAGAVYATEVETFSRIVANGVAGNGPASFTVTTKNGLIYEYGGTVDSRVYAGSVDHDSCLGAVACPRPAGTGTGNAITLAYFNEAQSGAYTQRHASNRVDCLPDHRNGRGTVLSRRLRLFRSSCQRRSHGLPRRQPGTRSVPARPDRDPGHWRSNADQNVRAWLRDRPGLGTTATGQRAGVRSVDVPAAHRDHLPERRERLATHGRHRGGRLDRQGARAARTERRWRHGPALSRRCRQRQVELAHPARNPSGLRRAARHRPRDDDVTHDHSWRLRRQRSHAIPGRAERVLVRRRLHERGFHGREHRPGPRRRIRRSGFRRRRPGRPRGAERRAHADHPCAPQRQRSREHCTRRPVRHDRAVHMDDTEPAAIDALGQPARRRSQRRRPRGHRRADLQQIGTQSEVLRHAVAVERVRQRIHRRHRKAVVAGIDGHDGATGTPMAAPTSCRCAACSSRTARARSSSSRRAQRPRRAIRSTRRSRRTGTATAVPTCCTSMPPRDSGSWCARPAKARPRLSARASVRLPPPSGSTWTPMATDSPISATATATTATACATCCTRARLHRPIWPPRSSTASACARALRTFRSRAATTRA